jgi:methionine-rich copper-binding protein CopC
LWLARAVLLFVSWAAWAQGPRVVESAPQANAVIGGRSSAFYVRFDRPVDHRTSTLVIKQNGTVVEKLEPRLESSPDVLFARAPTLPPGDYMLHWSVKPVTDPSMAEGEIPFTVSSDK